MTTTNNSSVFYNDPIFQKAVKNLNEEDIQFFKDLQEWKIDISKKKDLKKRYKDIQLRMVSNFNFQEIRRFIKIMYYIGLENRDKVAWYKMLRKWGNVWAWKNNDLSWVFNDINEAN